MKKKDKVVFCIINIIAIIGVVLIFTSTSVITDKSDKCWEHNSYSNLSDSSYFFGNCWVKVCDTYESSERCGTLGFSCYETSEPYTRMGCHDVCFKSKTGERC